MENELRTIVMGYMQKLFCQMALVKKVMDDFKNVYAPVQQSTQSGGRNRQGEGDGGNAMDPSQRINTEDDAAIGGGADEEESKTTKVLKLHMDTMKIKHE